MSEIVDFVNHGAALVTPSVAESLIRKLPLWKAEFAQINAPKFPHLVNQLEFLTDAIEDAVEGAYKELPYIAIAEAIFAVTYAHKKMDIIPDFMESLGRADDSSVVRAVLIRNEKAFESYAHAQNFKWDSITAEP